MSRLIWNDLQERTIETGLSNGILYVYDANTQTYNDGVAWNGLTLVSEQNTGGEHNALYAGNKTYATVYSKEDYGIKIESYTYPDEFEECDGVLTDESGAKVGQQTRSRFGFCYRTEVGDGVTQQRGYKLHVVYGCQAAPSEVSRKSIGESPEGIAFGWECTTIPQELESHSPSAMISLDSRVLHKVAMQDVENILYGTDTTPATLPSMQTIMNVITEVTKEYVDSGDQRTLEDANQNTQEIVDYLSNKVVHKKDLSIDGKPVNGMNFPVNDIVRDGLVSIENITPKITSNELFVQLSAIKKDSWYVIARSTTGTTTDLFHLETTPQGRIRYYLGGGYYDSKTTIKNNEVFNLIVYIKDSLLTLIINGVVETHIFTQTFSLVNTAIEFLSNQTGVTIYNIVYNRKLTPSKIQHNFQVLNNSPSVTGINADGNEYAFGTDSNHVVMDTGYNVEETINSIYEACAAPFVGTNGVASANNAIAKSKVLSAEISGNTVKNYLSQSRIGDIICNGFGNKKPISYIEDGVECWMVKAPNLELISNPSVGDKYRVKLRAKSSNTNQSDSGVGFYIRTTHSDDTYTNNILVNNTAKEWANKDALISITKETKSISITYGFGGEILLDKSKCYFVKEECASFITESTSEPLASTQAIIDVNGEKHTIYEPQIKGETKVVDGKGNIVPPGTPGAMLSSLKSTDPTLPDLGSVSSVSDTLDVVSGVLAGNTEEIVLDKNSTIHPSVQPGALCYRIMTNEMPQLKTNSKVSSNFPSNIGSFNGVEGVVCISNRLYVYILASRLQSQTIDGVKAWLQANPISVRYQLATPTTTQLTPAQVEIYSQHKKVILLPFAEDKVTLNEDGSSTWVDASCNYTLTDNSTFIQTTDATKEKTLYFACNDLDNVITGTGGVYSIFPSSSNSWNEDFESISLTSAKSKVRLRILKSRLETEDVNGLLKYLKENPIPNIFQKATPTTTPIPKELTPTLSLQKNNSLKVNTPVAASDFKGTYPKSPTVTTKETNQRLAALENVVIQNNLQ